MFFGGAAEVVVFSLALTYLIKQVYAERNALSLKVTRHQNDMMHAYVQGIEKERERIAGELHDDIGSRLSNLQRILVGMEIPQNNYIESQVEILHENVRRLSHELAPPAIHLKGLIQMITELLEEQKLVSRTHFTLQHYDIPQTLPESIRKNTYRIVQEAVNNINKHADASQADIQLFLHKHKLVLTIEDNGKGFMYSQLYAGIGLSLIQARVATLNGMLDIHSAPGKGTQLMVSIPFD
jgi:signal transduction histidine kinase